MFTKIQMRWKQISIATKMNILFGTLMFLVVFLALTSFTIQSIRSRVEHKMALITDVEKHLFTMRIHLEESADFCSSGPHTIHLQTMKYLKSPKKPDQIFLDEPDFPFPPEQSLELLIRESEAMTNRLQTAPGLTWFDIPGASDTWNRLDTSFAEFKSERESGPGIARKSIPGKEVSGYIHIDQIGVMINAYAASLDEIKGMINHLFAGKDSGFKTLIRSGEALKKIISATEDPVLMQHFEKMQDLEKNYMDMRRPPGEQGFLHASVPLRAAIGLHRFSNSNPLFTGTAYDDFVEALDIYLMTSRLVRDTLATIHRKISFLQVQSTQLTLSLDFLIQNTDKARVEIGSYMEKLDFISRILNLSAVIMALILGLFTARVLSKSIKKNLNSLIHAACELRDGNMEVCATIGSYDELGELAKSFEAMRERIRTLVEELEGQAAAAESRLSDAIASISEGFCLYDENDCLVLGNSKYREIHSKIADRIIPGVEFSEIITECAINGLFPDAVGREREWVSERIRRHRKPKGAFEQRLSSGKWLLVSEYRTKEGGIVGIHTDITHRKNTENELKAAKETAETANQAKSAFLANMSHELRTPLNAIIGYSEMIIEDIEDMEEEEKGTLDNYVPDLNKIRSSGRHLLTLINDILDLSKIEAGKMELFLETFQISDMIEEVVTTIHPLAEKNNNKLIVSYPDELGKIHTDVTKLRQSLFNLLSNACKFTENGNILFKVSLDSGMNDKSNKPQWVHFIVRDTGIGINREQIRKLFQAFTQADVSTTRKYGGTGLGMAITRQFCRMMGGDVYVKSKAGVGSVFTIKLPLNGPKPQARPKPKLVKGKKQSANPPPGTGPQKDAVL